MFLSSLCSKSNCIGIVVADFFKQTEKNSKWDKVVATRVRLLGPQYMVCPTSVSTTKDIPSVHVENSTSLLLNPAMLSGK